MFNEHILYWAIYQAYVARVRAYNWTNKGYSSTSVARTLAERRAKNDFHLLPRLDGI